MWVVTLAASDQSGFAIVGIYAEYYAQLKAAEIRARIENGENEPAIIGVEEYPIE